MTENDETNENGGTDDAAGDKRSSNLSALNKDVSHPFDQTNGIVDGLEGDADDPETFEKTQESAEPAIRNPLVESGDFDDDRP